MSTYLHISLYTSGNATRKQSGVSSCDCAGCTKQNCGKCKMCLDMPKFGGKGKKKQKCLLRRYELSTNAAIVCTKQDIETLLPSRWLNDRVNNTKQCGVLY